MRSRFTIITFFMLVSCTPCLIPQPGPAQIQLTSTPFVEMQTIIISAQGNTLDVIPTLQDLIKQAKTDLAQRLTISTNHIALVESEEAEWSDSSLGCPQPDMTYLEVITPGYRIVLEANGQTYEYHSNRDTYVVYCENQIPPILPKP